MLGPMSRHRVPEAPPDHVFEDRTGRRKPLVLTAVLVVLLALAWLAVDVVVRLRALPPPVPPGEFDGIVASLEAAGSEPRIGSSLVPVGPTTLPDCDAPAARPETLDRPVVAFMPAGDAAAAAAFARHCATIDLVLAETLVIDGAGAAVLRLPQAARPARPASRPVYEVVTLAGLPSVDSVNRLLGDGDALGRILDDLDRLVDRSATEGICLDLSSVPGIDPAALAQAVGRMAERLGTQTCLVGAIDAAFWGDAALVDRIDLAVARAFVEPTTPTEAIAAPGWLDAHIARVTGQVPADKRVIALGVFGHVWQSGRAAPGILSFAAAIDLMADAGGNIAFMPELGTLRARFVDERRRLNDIWLPDATVLSEQLRRLDPAQAVAIWPLGAEDPAVWSLLATQGQGAAAIEVLGRPVDLDGVALVTGTGPFLVGAEAASGGLRTPTWDAATGRILAQTYSAVPRPHRIILGGATSPSGLHITFDGLPDDETAGDLLGALAQAGVTAAFFVDWAEILARPDMLRRVIEAGHEIGVDQARRPVFAPDWAQDLFDNGAQLALWHETGQRSLFVRHGADRLAWPGDREAFDAFARQVDRGYLAVSPGIVAPFGVFDAGSLVSRISAATAEGAAPVISFELGGNSAAVAARLPDVLSGLLAEGFHFRTLSGSAGLLPDEAMPPVADGVLWRDAIALGVVEFYLVGLTPLFFGLMILAAVRSLIYLALAVWRGSRTEYDPDFCPPVTVIVPAYNEELVIEKCVESLLASDYPDLRIIIVDDGSTDRTYVKVMTAFGQDGRVVLLHEENHGKWHAANLALSVVTTPFFIIADADSLFFPDTIRWLVQPFRDQAVGAVAGLVEVGNRENLLTACQALEYFVSQSVMRRAYEAIEGILVVPGAVGAWRTEAVHAARDFSGETITEDADLTVAVHRAGYRVRFQEQARAITEAPAAVRPFMRQRLRWTFGMLEVSWKHRAAITERLPVGISIVDAIWFGLISTFLSPVVDLLLLLLLGKIAFGFFAGDATAMTGLPVAMLVSYFLLTGLDLLTMLVASGFARRFDWRLIALVPVLRFGYRQLLYAATINAIWHAALGRMAGWNKLERTGGVFRPGAPVVTPPD